MQTTKGLSLGVGECRSRAEINGGAYEEGGCNKDDGAGEGVNSSIESVILMREI